MYHTLGQKGVKNEPCIVFFLGSKTLWKYNLAFGSFLDPLDLDQMGWILIPLIWPWLHRRPIRVVVVVFVYLFVSLSFRLDSFRLVVDLFRFVIVLVSALETASPPKSLSSNSSLSFCFSQVDFCKTSLKFSSVSSQSVLSSDCFLISSKKVSLQIAALHLFPQLQLQKI